MKNYVKLFATLTLAVVLTFNLNAQPKKQRPKGSKMSYALSLPKQPLSQDEKLILTDLRQEKKLYHDVYFTLFTYWNIPVFNRLASSEEYQTQSVKQMLSKYNLPDNTNDLEIGKFTDSKYADLYNQYVNQGKKSLKDAYITAASMEEKQIQQLDSNLTKVDNDDITIVLKNIRRVDAHHLAILVKQLKTGYQYDYQPQYISKDEFQKILFKDKIRKRLRPKKNKQKNKNFGQNTPNN